MNHSRIKNAFESLTVEDAEYMCAKNDDGLWDFWEYMKDIESLYIKYLYYNGTQPGEEEAAGL